MVEFYFPLKHKTTKLAQNSNLKSKILNEFGWKKVGFYFTTKTRNNKIALKSLFYYLTISLFKKCRKKVGFSVHY